MQRRLLYFVPAIATLVTGYALLGPGRARAVVACRVLAPDDADGKLRSLRLQVVERLGGIEEPRSLDGVEVFLDGEPIFAGAAGSDGLIEVRVARPKPGPSLLSVSRRKTLLVTGNVESARVGLRVLAPGVPGTSKGSLTMGVELPRGQLTPPFAETLRVTVRAPDGSPVSGLVKASAEGAQVDGASVPLDGDGVARVSILPFAQTIAFEISAEASNGSNGSWSGELPVAVGAIWLDRSSTRSHLALAVRSPHKAAFVSLYDDRGRIGGLAVPLFAGSDGLYRGDAEIDAGSSAPLTALVATDAQERGLTTVSWPIDPPTRSIVPSPLHRLLDGIPVVEARERVRMATVRRITAAFVSASTLLEIALLVLESRRTRRDLTDHFAANALEPEEPEATGVTAPTDAAQRPPRPSLVVSGMSTAWVVVSMAILLVLAGVTLAALSFVTS